MATIKTYTDLSQSKKLAEILPPESADMYYLAKPDDTNSNMVVSDICIPRKSKNDGQAFGELYAWSLAALLEVLPMIDFTTPQLIGTPKTLYRCLYNDSLKSHAYDNPIDACYELILKLNELKML